MDLAALGLTLRLAFVTTLCLLVIATPLAAWIADAAGAPSRTTRAHILARRIAQAAVALPLVLPPTVLGLYLLLGMGPATSLGRALIAILGHPLAFSFPGLVVGSILYSLPFAVQPLVLGFEGVPRELRETAAVLGASRWTVFRRVTLPLAAPSFLTAAVLAFTHTVGEFGVVLMIGGDIPGVTRTLSISIYDQVQEMNYSAANHTSLLLIALAFLTLLALYARGARRNDGGRWIA
ncbi:molybdate transport system permease protein [Bryocella elongata]|uniref:Molybdenum transport system permease n=1 Tax=Bryocella elongata TaxID=863522 RepID=A0A1H5ZPU1_9BACT|nr:molybdate ABC transporter permease subunit [Bryocella elongata]SEG38212.1 molybdate transport system permease protein [Bryocella elongata]